MTAIGREYDDRGEYDIYLTVLKTDTRGLREARQQLGLPIGWDWDESQAHSVEQRYQIQRFHAALNLAAAEERRMRAAQLQRNEMRHARMMMSAPRSRVAWPAPPATVPTTATASFDLRRLMD